MDFVSSEFIVNRAGWYTKGDVGQVQRLEVASVNNKVFRGDRACIQDVPPIPSLKCEDRSICVEWLYMTWESPLLWGGQVETVFTQVKAGMDR